MFSQNPATRFVVENEISDVKIAIFIAEMDSAPSIIFGAPNLCNSNHWKLPFEQFPPDFGQKTRRISSANGREFSLLLS